MIDRKQAWESSHPDRIVLLKTHRLKELMIACKWYSDSKRTQHTQGFQMRAEALSRELEDRRHKTTIKTGVSAAVISLFGAAASWFGAFHTSSVPLNNSKSSTSTEQVQQSTPQTQNAKLESTHPPDTTKPEVSKSQATPAPQPIRKES
jgi:cytoskeletal protein RodZ